MELLLRQGEVGGATLCLSTGEFAEGDRVVTTRNSRALGVVNGSRGSVLAVDEHKRTVTVQLDISRGDEQRRVTVLRAEYRNAGHLAHG